MMSYTSSPQLVPMTFVPRMEPPHPCFLPGNQEMVLDLSVGRKSNSPAYPPQCSPSSSEATSLDFNDNCAPTKIKASRPFKAYPMDTFALTCMGSGTDLVDKNSSEAYAQFRERMLAVVQGNPNGTNKNMRRTQNQSSHHTADPTYWEKRRKNNEAAKRSRDARRAKEDEIAIRCAFLEHENVQLKIRAAALETENERLKKMLFH